MAEKVVRRSGGLRYVQTPEMVQGIITQRKGDHHPPPPDDFHQVSPPDEEPVVVQVIGEVRPTRGRRVTGVVQAGEQVAIIQPKRSAVIGVHDEGAGTFQVVTARQQGELPKRLQPGRPLIVEADYPVVPRDRLDSGQLPKGTVYQVDPHDLSADTTRTLSTARKGKGGTRLPIVEVAGDNPVIEVSSGSSDPPPYLEVVDGKGGVIEVEVPW